MGGAYEGNNWSASGEQVRTLTLLAEPGCSFDPVNRPEFGLGTDGHFHSGLEVGIRPGAEPGAMTHNPAIRSSTLTSPRRPCGTSSYRSSAGGQSSPVSA